MTTPTREAPLVSVIMNCYNGERYLREAIDSVYAQTYPNWEIVFWDNVSTDASAAIAQSYDERLKYFRADELTQLGFARNLAMRRARGDFISFLDVDDVFLPDTISRFLAAVTAGDYALAYGGRIIIDESGRETGRLRPVYQSGDVFSQQLHHYEIAMSGVMLRRAVLERDGLEFDTSFKFGPDHNLFMKIAATCDVAVVREPVVKYRKSPNSLTRKLLHVVSREVGRTLDELEARYPEKCREDIGAMTSARAKLHFYDAVNQISVGDYGAARAALRPVVTQRWQYLLIYLALFAPLPREWVMRALNR
jgi:glycosyltransferase involved in cell wall biosynthesis